MLCKSIYSYIISNKQIKNTLHYRNIALEYYQARKLYRTRSTGKY